MSLFDIQRYDLFYSDTSSKSKELVLKNLLKDAKKRKKASQSKIDDAAEEETQPSVVTEEKVEEEPNELDGVPKKKKKKKSEKPDANNNSTKEESITSAEIVVQAESPVKNESEKSEEVEDLEKTQQEVPKNEEEEEEEEVEKVVMPDIEGPHEFGGFTVLGDYKEKALDKVNQVLPNWLAHPSVFKPDVTTGNLPVLEMPNLDSDLKQKLLDNGISHFFPVQYQVIPAILNDVKLGAGVGCAGFRTRDICCSSPTGSGKTLAFVLPIIQCLKNRVVRRVRALVILPVRTLAQQVYKVFQTYAEDFGLKVVLIMGEKSFEKEKMSLVKKRSDGYECLADVIVATPGKLVDHISQTEGFDLRHLRFLVIDEADRVIDDIKHNWLTHVEKAVYKTTDNKTDFDCDFIRAKPGPITIANCLKINIPFQKLLFSATMSDNSQKLKQLNLFQPRLFSAMKNNNAQKSASSPPPADEADNQVEDAKSKKSSNKAEENKNLFKPAEDIVQQFVIPKCLIEKYVVCTPSYKPLILFHFLTAMKYKHVLCFTNSKECTHRLFLLAKCFDEFKVAKITSLMKSDQKKKILSWFEAGKINLLVSTDVMARGMDLSNVQLVVSYDCPSHVETYVHRVGRTARAGKEGTAISLVQVKEVTHFKTLRKKCGGKENYSRLRIPNEDLELLIPKFKESLELLPQTLKDEKKRTNTKSIDLGI